MIYWIAHGLICIFSKIIAPVTVFGKENFPPDKGVIIASNHLSNLDPVILGLASGRKLSYVAKESLFRNKLFSFLLYRVGAFPIRRDYGDVGAIKEALRRLKKRGRIVVFPEGTRKSQSGPKKVQPGVGLLAVKGDAVIVPAYIRGSDKVMAPGSNIIKPGRITVTFGTPLPYIREDSYLKIAEKVMQSIHSLSVA